MDGVDDVGWLGCEDGWVVEPDGAGDDELEGDSHEDVEVEPLPVVDPAADPSLDFLPDSEDDSDSLALIGINAAARRSLLDCADWLVEVSIGLATRIIPTVTKKPAMTAAPLKTYLFLYSGSRWIDNTRSSL